MKKSELMEAVQDIPEGKEKLIEILKLLFPDNTSYSNGTSYFYKKDGTDAAHVIHGDLFQGCFEGKALFSFYIDTVVDVDYSEYCALTFELDNKTILNLPT